MLLEGRQDTIARESLENSPEIRDKEKGRDSMAANYVTLIVNKEPKI